MKMSQSTFIYSNFYYNNYPLLDHLLMKMKQYFVFNAQHVDVTGYGTLISSLRKQLNFKITSLIVDLISKKKIL